MAQMFHLRIFFYMNENKGNGRIFPELFLKIQQGLSLAKTSNVFKLSKLQYNAFFLSKK